MFWPWSLAGMNISHDVRIYFASPSPRSNDDVILIALGVMRFKVSIRLNMIKLKKLLLPWAGFPNWPRPVARHLWWSTPTTGHPSPARRWNMELVEFFLQRVCGQILGNNLWSNCKWGLYFFKFSYWLLVGFHIFHNESIQSFPARATGQGRFSTPWGRTTREADPGGSHKKASLFFLGGWEEDEEEILVMVKSANIEWACEFRAIEATNTLWSCLIPLRYFISLSKF